MQGRGDKCPAGGGSGGGLGQELGCMIRSIINEDTSLQVKLMPRAPSHCALTVQGAWPHKGVREPAAAPPSTARGHGAEQLLLCLKPVVLLLQRQQEERRGFPLPLQPGRLALSCRKPVHP